MATTTTNNLLLSNVAFAVGNCEKKTELTDKESILKKVIFKFKDGTSDAVNLPTELSFGLPQEFMSLQIDMSVLLDFVKPTENVLFLVPEKFTANLDFIKRCAHFCLLIIIRFICLVCLNIFCTYQSKIVLHRVAVLLGCHP